MDLTSVCNLKPLNKYFSHTIQLSIVHICPLDGQPNESNCKRSVIAVEHKQTQQTLDCDGDNERKYLVLLLYGSYAKTPFKISGLKVGQTLSLKRFQTHLMPKNKTFKCENGEIINNFYQSLVLVKSEYEPIIKMVNESDIVDVVDTEMINETVVSPNTKNSRNSESNSDQLNTSSNQKYSYKKLLEILNLQPVIGRTYVNLFGILIKNDQNNAFIYLADETLHSFEIKLLPCKSGVRHYPPFRTGDIIRIHRLLLKPNSIKECICMHPKDLVVFEAFKDTDLFNRLTCASECTIEEIDKTRKIELEEWFSNQLLEECLSKLKHFGYINIASQLLDVHTTQNRSVLHIWDATQPSVKTSNRFRSYDNPMQQCFENEPLISLIDRNEMSLYITVYDEHSIAASKLKPFDIIVIFNAHIKDEPRNAGFSNIALNSTYRFGKCIRFVDKNSYLGKKLLTRIEDYKVISAINTTDRDEMDNNDEEFPTQSQPIISDSLLAEDVEQNQSTNTNHRTAMNMSDSDSDNLDAMVELIEAQASYLPSVIIVDIPTKSISIQSLLNQAIDKAYYKIQARVATYLVFDIKDVVSVICTNKDYHHLIPVSEANVDINALINDRNELNCLQCKSTAKLFFRICFVIEDTNRDRLTAELIGYDAQLFFGATPLQVLSQPEKSSYVEQVLKFLCASKCSSFVAKSKNILLNWVIQPTIVSTDPTKFIYRIRTVTQIEKSNKSVGINFNT